MNSSPKLKIDWATHESAKMACEIWHYSGCIPKSKLVKIGAWEDGKFIGVVIFSHGATALLGKPYGLGMTECVELTRVALTNHKTPVSRILSIAIKFLKKTNPGLRLIVSFADQTQGHHGGIYQATNWTYSGKTSSAEFFRDPSGKLWHPRRASKTPNRQKQLVTSNWTIETQQPKHRYLMPLDDEMRKKITKLSKPYPKRVCSVESGTSGFQPEGGGESPTHTLHLGEK